MLYLKEIIYNNVSLAKSLVIVSFILFVAMILYIIARFKLGKKEKFDNCFKLMAKSIALLLMCAILIDLTKEDHQSIPLSTIDNKISVKGQRVEIGELDDKYGYKNFKKDNESVTMSSDSHVFKFEYDEVFESGKLSDEYGRYRMLDKEDIDYLKSKQSKGEK